MFRASIDEADDAAFIVPDCAICCSCLAGVKSTNGNEEHLKAISACGHVFHESCIERWINAHRTRTSKAQCPICRQEFKRSEVVVLNFRLERHHIVVETEARKLNKTIAQLREEHEVALRQKREELANAKLAEHLLKSDLEKTQAMFQDCTAQKSALQTEMEAIRVKLSDYQTMIKRQQAKIKYLDFKTKEEGDELVAAFISTFRSASEIDQDSMLQDLFYEVRGGKQVLKGVQGRNAFLTREIDRLNRKLVEKNYYIEKLRQQLTSCPNPPPKKRRLTLSDELVEDPEWMALIMNPPSDISSKDIIDQMRVKSEETPSESNCEILCRRQKQKRIF